MGVLEYIHEQSLPLDELLTRVRVHYSAAKNLEEKHGYVQSTVEQWIGTHLASCTVQEAVEKIRAWGSSIGKVGLSSDLGQAPAVVLHILIQTMLEKHGADPTAISRIAAEERTLALDLITDAGTMSDAFVMRCMMQYKWNIVRITKTPTT
ncbi:MAG: hypothetical protein HOO67_03950 [Candidatus Peribacteraceae bacterium]|nr:hypothetical protein [Candidatus Peribacteraceae bacterium]